jgi:hypothetical protein
MTWKGKEGHYMTRKCMAWKGMVMETPSLLSSGTLDLSHRVSARSAEG